MPLMDSDLDPDPFVQFGRWFEEAKAAVKDLPEAMMLATATREGEVSVRSVLLKEFDRRGLVFFTNYNSRKAAQMHDNPRAALAFWWPPLERQVRIEGAVVRTTEEESNDYWATRPRGSQLGAWASDQSKVIAGRGDLDARFEELSKCYREGAIPRPPHWGGYRVIPDYLEFWQGRASRLHDRIAYTRSGSAWTIARLAP